MKIVEKLIARKKDNRNGAPVTIAFIGDSVTQGSFELIPLNREGAYPLREIFDQDMVYHQQLRRMLAELYPSVPINTMNVGVSGGHASKVLENLERDVINHHPDLAVVCFGLNDSVGKADRLERYKQALDTIFGRLKEAGIETIFMTPNMLCTEVSEELFGEEIIAIAERTARVQNEGWLERFLEEGKKVAKTHGVKVCDCYQKWKKLYQCGVEITPLLANRINHPNRFMHGLFATSLLETMLLDED